MGDRTCSFADCDARVNGRGLCSGHYRQQRQGKQLAPIRRGWTVEQRFLEKLVKSDGCWQWVGAIDGSTGYGNFWDGERVQKAHRHAWITLRGPIADGLDLDHLCRNRGCVNPDHLEPVTRRINLNRGIGISATNAAKTHCDNGHEFTADNTYLWQGTRQCRTCRRLADARRRTNSGRETQ